MKLTQRFPLLFVALLVSAALVLYFIGSKTENRASKILETSSPRKEVVEQDSKESIPVFGK